MNATELEFFLTLAKLGTVVSRKFDGSLGGLGWNEFIILHRLSEAPEKKLRRIDLAEKVGLTASGITRLLLPMEKIGLVSKETNADDARVSLVTIAPGGERKLEEALDRMQYLTGELLKNQNPSDLAALSKTLESIGGAVMWR